MRRLALLFVALFAAWWSGLRAHAEEPALHVKLVPAHVTPRISCVEGPRIDPYRACVRMERNRPRRSDPQRAPNL